MLGTWVPALSIFEKSMEMGKFDKSRLLSDGSMLTFKKARESSHSASSCGLTPPISGVPAGRGVRRARGRA